MTWKQVEGAIPVPAPLLSVSDIPPSVVGGKLLEPGDAD